VTIDASIIVNTTAKMQPKITRRQEYAEATRKAILIAARQLFREEGFFTTKVDDIAALARVSPATVYAVSGGKHELLQTLIEIWTSAPIIAATVASVATMDSPTAVIDSLARSCRLMREESGDIIRMLLQTAPHDKAAAQYLVMATKRYRRALSPFAHRLFELGALQPETTLKEAVDILWFYFGYSALFTLVDENKWNYESAEKWLAKEAFRSLTSKDQDSPAPPGRTT
jgi:AcrR family transcriptional regulator